MTEPCQKCIDRWGQEPSSWGDSVMELEAYDFHVKFHLDVNPHTGEKNER